MKLTIVVATGGIRRHLVEQGSRQPKLTDKPPTGRFRTALNRNIRGRVLRAPRRRPPSHAHAARPAGTIKQIVGIAS